MTNTIKNAKLRKGQSGLTLIEVLVAMAITGVVSAAVVSTLYQLQAVSASHYARIMAVNQVENAIQYINRDVQSSQTITPHGTYGFNDPGLVLTWVSWDNNETTTVTYYLTSAPPPLTTYSLMRKLNSNPTTTVADSVVFYPLCVTTVAVAVSPRDTVIQVASTSAFPPVGALVLASEPSPVTYSGKTSTSFTGIPHSGSGSITLAHAVGQSVIMYSTYSSYDSANHKLMLQITSNVSHGGKQIPETRQLVIIPRPGS